MEKRTIAFVLIAVNVVCFVVLVAVFTSAIKGEETLDNWYPAIGAGVAYFVLDVFSLRWFVKNPDAFKR